jgi:hypothetical protein
MPDRIFADASTAAVRQQAVDLIHQARNPSMLYVNGEFAQVDKQTADREAQLALAAALVYLGDVINAQGANDA